jgi:predicted O-methyltransferase YrrM
VKSRKKVPTVPRFPRITEADAGHLAADVYSDAVLTWPLIVRGGLIIFDDYLWDGSPSPLEMPKRGIDAFLRTVAGNYRTALKEY